MEWIQFSSVAQSYLFATPWTAAYQASLTIANSWSSPKLMSIESVVPSNYLILCHPLLLLPSLFPSIGVFSNESALRIRWPKCGFRGDLKRGLTRMSWLPISPSCPPFQPLYLYEIFSTFQNKPCHSSSLPSVPAFLMKPPPISPDDILTTDCPSVFHFDTIFFTFFLTLLGFMHKMKLLSQPL